MSTEEHVLKIVFDGGDVDKGLARARTGVDDLQKSATRSASGLTLIKGGLQGIDRAEREASKAMRGLGQSFGGLNSTMINTTGLIGDVAGLLSGGGAIAIAMAAGGFAVSALTKHWEALNKQQDAVLNKDWARLTAGADALRAQSDRIAALTAQLRGPETRESINQGFDDNQKRMLDEKQKLENEISSGKTVDQNSEIRKLIKQKNIEIDRNEEERQKRLLVLFKSQNDELAKRASIKGAPSGRDYFAEVDKSLGDEIASDKSAADAAFESLRGKAFADKDKIISNNRDQIASDAEMRMKANNDWLDEITAQNQQAKDDINQTWAGFGSQMTSNIVGGVAGGFTTLFTEMAAGNKHAAEIALSSFLSSTGQQIIASGVQSVVQGSLFAANPLTAAAAPGMIGAGIAAIGIGTAMAAGGAGISASIPKGGGAATGGRGASSERGTGSGSSRSGGGSDGGGTTVININYAAGGPNPEDTARDISDVLARAGRRRFNRSGPRI